MHIIVLVGPPGSGKSTMAHKPYLEDYAYINQDSQGKFHMDAFKNALEDRRPIVVDRMGFSKEQRDRYLVPAKELGYRTTIIVLHESYDTCLSRCLARQNHETVKCEQDAKDALQFFFTHYERPEDNEADTVTRMHPLIYMSCKTVICDLDGTLCNTSHREHFVRRPKGERKDWKSFFGAIGDDTANQWCRHIIDALLEDHHIVLCSGRPDDYRGVTTSWLAHQHIKYDHLFMRNRNDARPDNVIKEIILDFEILTRYNVMCAIDDRQQVVDMWRRRGITCLQCAPGDF